MINLVYPNLFLFLYDLREGLGEDSQSLTENQKDFAAKLPTNIRSSLFDRDSVFESDYLELLTNGFEDFTDSDKPFEGHYYPVRLNDTYGLLLGCSFQEDRTPHPVTCLAKFQAKIKEKLNNQYPNIGQTWLIVTEMDNPNISPEEVAKKCCQSLNIGLKWERDFQGKGSFLGGSIFELSRYELLMDESTQNAKPRTIQEIQKNIHLIIAVMPSSDAAKIVWEDFNTELLRLFCYRHKVFWAYAQSRYLKQQLKKDFRVINQLVGNIGSQNLKQLRKTVDDAQKISPKYTIKLNYLDAQIRTIEINAINYSRRIGTIGDRLNQIQAQNGQNPIAQILPILSWFQSATATSNPTSTNPTPLLSQLANLQHPYDLKFLEKFSKDVEEKYQLQVQKDYANLSPGSQLLQDLINSSRAITEIEQAERDRNFQNTVGIIGAGLAVGSIVASIEIPTEQNDNFLNPPLDLALSTLHIPGAWLPFAIKITFSLSAALAAGLFTATLIWIGQRRLKK
ncbi:MAG: hypothetical protein JGK17_09950 [Microcoleus sp. PH2017_10_PVI_O_A]|uniref:hypothetical protein n=1 Tax=unclassified Microcoleus TaxID=2642155 RepID=UPI001DC54213|nr:MULTISPECIES: hypothetical protein [unclassified Microcoleus]TAE85181.1 MAG: hypothetical protein EAZ83_03180 [Oscillatoriales cyanobacterium]MCC3405895.1 hypothetical protein [Microcoleus sp. PH2017_10_PVI_O_A]MCC3460464.1 hypothetical protein [Microcoleus sp. PH2017_11_PCY_U_A]MCC3478725.1 hypothetical protein [Microcoleus sp. PH2017_12_PCY_D_A]MCC3528873.1 hypothetical protein [Microcoleus sp. PH2017_21_RUC_O_A]